MEKESEITSAQGILLRCAKTSASGTELADCLRREAQERPLEQQALLEETARGIQRIVGARSTKVLPGNRAGEAQQGVHGSSVIDVTKAVRPGLSGGGIVDTGMLKDTVRHEERHEEQAREWNAESVNLDNGQTITRTAVSEFDAMSAQPSIDGITSEYRGYWYLVLGNMTPETARGIAKSGDLLSLAA